MSTRAQEKADLRAARQAAEQADRQQRQRRTRLIWLAAIAGAAIVVLVVGIVISQSGGSGSGNASADTAAVEKEFSGLPQQGAFLGDPKAPATLIEYGDLQCPACAAYSNDMLPQVLDRYVRPGRVRLELRPIQIIGPDSQPAAQMAAATSFQNRMWQFADLFYRNQGIENTGYVDQGFLEKMAKATPGLDAGRALTDRSSPRAKALAARWVTQGNRAAVDATPTFFLQRAGQAPRQVPITTDFVSKLGEQLPQQ